jgi:hypothetical protein
MGGSHPCLRDEWREHGRSSRPAKEGVVGRSLAWRRHLSTGDAEDPIEAVRNICSEK